MKTNQIFLLIGIIGIVIFLMNYKKIFGKKISTKLEESTPTLTNNISGRFRNRCMTEFGQKVRSLSSVYTPPTYGPPSITMNWANFEKAMAELDNCISK